MPIPTTEQWLKISSEFLERSNFPNLIGAVDGKQVEIINPEGSLFFGYKGYSCIQLMAVVDADYRFIYVSIGAYGKDCDSKVFSNCSFWKNLISNKLQLPEPRPLPGTTTPLPFFLVGDS